MDRINELLAGADTDETITARLAELSPDELGELNDLLLAELDRLAEADPSTESVAAMADVRDRVRAVRAENTRRTDAAADLERQRDEILAEVTEPAAETTPVEPAEGEGEGEPVEPVEPAAPEAAEPVPVAAAALPVRPPVRDLQRYRNPAHDPVIPDEPGVVITAAGDLPGFSAAQRIPALAQVGQAFAERAQAARAGRARGRLAIANFRAVDDAPRVSPRNDYLANQAVVDAAMDAHRQRVANPQALVAAGGLCAPPSPIYTFQNVAVAERPLQGALARVPGDRGAVTFIEPPTLAGTAGAVDIWTSENDAEPSDPTTKPCLEITCGDPVTVEIDAVTLCLTVGNFSRRTFPEQFAAWFSLARAMHARVAERNLLDGIDALIPAAARVTDGTQLDFGREYLEALTRLAAHQRQVHRMARGAPVVVAQQEWVLDMIRAGLIRQQPGDNASVVADATIESYFTTAHIVPVWLKEGRTGAGQDLPAVGGGDIGGYPSTVEVHMWHPEAFFWLDGGELDLGTEIRDSALNAVNNVQAWLETFEAVGFNGLWANRVTLTGACASGETTLPGAFTCTSGS